MIPIVFFFKVHFSGRDPDVQSYFHLNEPLQKISELDGFETSRMIYFLPYLPSLSAMLTINHFKHRTGMLCG